MTFQWRTSIYLLILCFSLSFYAVCGPTVRKKSLFLVFFWFHFQYSLTVFSLPKQNKYVFWLLRSLVVLNALALLLAKTVKTQCCSSISHLKVPHRGWFARGSKQAILSFFHLVMEGNDVPTTIQSHMGWHHWPSAEGRLLRFQPAWRLRT